MYQYLDFEKIDSKNQTLLELKKESITKQCELLENNGERMKSAQTKMDKVIIEMVPRC